MYWHAGAATVFQHWCVFVLGDVLLRLYSAGSCSAREGRDNTDLRTNGLQSGRCSLPLTSLMLITTLVQLVSKCTYGTHRAWACVVIGLLRHLTSTNFNVIISACPRSNNTLLSIGGTVTPARWVHWHPNDWFDLKSNASSAFLILKKSRIDHNESVLML